MKRSGWRVFVGNSPKKKKIEDVPMRTQKSRRLSTNCSIIHSIWLIIWTHVRSAVFPTKVMVGAWLREAIPLETTRGQNLSKIINDAPWARLDLNMSFNSLLHRPNTVYLHTRITKKEKNKQTLIQLRGIFNLYTGAHRQWQIKLGRGANLPPVNTVWII